MPETAAKPPERPQKAVKPKAKAKGAPTPKTASEAPKKTGRPSKYTPELVAEICERLSVGETMRQICRDEHMPHWTQVYEWMARDEALSLRVAHAREAGFEALAEETLQISDTPVMGQKQVMGDKSTYTTVEDMLGHRRLQIETRLKLLACWSPKRYGNKVQVGGDGGAPIKVEAQVEAETLLAALLKNVELKKQVDANE